MELPENIEVFDTTLSTLWIDEDGILCSVAKKGAPLTKDGLMNVYAVTKEIVKGKKICTLTQMTGISSGNKEIRDYALMEMTTFTKAMALIANSAFSTIIGNVFMSFSKPPFPMKIFTNEEEAKKWLKQYL